MREGATCAAGVTCATGRKAVAPNEPVPNEEVAVGVCWIARDPAFELEPKPLKLDDCARTAVSRERFLDGVSRLLSAEGGEMIREMRFAKRLKGLCEVADDWAGKEELPFALDEATALSAVLAREERSWWVEKEAGMTGEGENGTLLPGPRSGRLGSN